MRKAVFAGTFDPFTLGHLDIARRASKLFDTVYIAVMDNPGKKTARFTMNERTELIKDAVKDLANVETLNYDGLVVDLCRKLNADCMIRGLRNGPEIDYERQLEAVNRGICPDIETVFLLSKPEFAYINSSLVRQLMDIGIGIDSLVPNPKHNIYERKRL